MDAKTELLKMCLTQFEHLAQFTGYVELTSTESLIRLIKTELEKDKEPNCTY